MIQTSRVVSNRLEFQSELLLEGLKNSWAEKKEERPTEFRYRGGVLNHELNWPVRPVRSMMGRLKGRDKIRDRHSLPVCAEIFELFMTWKSSYPVVKNLAKVGALLSAVFTNRSSMDL